jgi:hypothetical protein
MQGSLPAGWLAFAGRELNPLDRDERFQLIFSSSSPGLSLTQRKFHPTLIRIVGQNHRIIESHLQNCWFTQNFSF